MKQLKLLFPVFIFLCFSRLLSSCCVRDDRISSENGFYFRFSDGSYIPKVELIGTGKVIEYGDYETDATITLNPADTVSSYRIFFEYPVGPDSSISGSGIVTMAYTRRPTYKSDECTETLVIVYDPHISGTTFTRTIIHNSSGLFDNAYVEITR